MHADKRSVSKFAIGSQYFLYFGVLGIFLPYFNLYCYHLGFSGLQIGVLSSLRSAALVVFPLIWGILADRLNLRKPIYIICNFISTAIWVFYLFKWEPLPYLASVVSLRLPAGHCLPVFKCLIEKAESKRLRFLTTNPGRWETAGTATTAALNFLPEAVCPFDQNP
jgi:MFS family permease